MWIMPFLCAVPNIFSLRSSQGFSQRLEGQCCFSLLPCAINIRSLSIPRGVCVFTKMAMVQGHLVAGNAGTAGWCPRACSDILHDELSGNSSVFAHPIRKHYQTFKRTQPHNGNFFRHFELFTNLSSLWIFLKVPVLQAVLTSLLHLHISVSLLMAVWSRWFTLSHMLALDLSSCRKCENSQTVQAIFILSVRQQNNFCLCCDKYFLMFWLHSLLSNSRILELVSLTKELLSMSF